MMKAGGGKRKGSQFERVVSRLLDQWWECPEGTFWRSVTSGGWSEAGDNAIRSRQPIWFPIITECKFYAKYNPLKHLEGRALLNDWVDQLKDSLSKDGIRQVELKEEIIEKFGLLIFKFNRTPIYVTAVSFVRDNSSLLPEIVIRYEEETSDKKEKYEGEIKIWKWDEFSNFYSKKYIYDLYGRTDYVNKEIV